MKLDLDQIKFARNAAGELVNPRGEIHDSTWMQGSFQEAGQRDPIEVFVEGEFFVVISGHTRVIAARRLGWRDIEGELKPCPDDLEAEMLLANVRHDPPASRLGAVLARLIAKGWSMERLARRQGLTTSEIQDYLALAAAPALLQRRVDAGEMGWSAFREASRQPRWVQEKIAEAEGPLTLRSARKLRREIKHPEKVAGGVIREALDESNSLAQQFKALTNKIGAAWDVLPESERLSIIIAVEVMEERWRDGTD